MRKPMVAVVRVRHRRYAVFAPPGRLVVIFHAHPLSSKPPAAQRLCLRQVGIARSAEASALRAAAAGSVFPIAMQKAAAQCLCGRAEAAVTAL
jgi:hypothetical protein